MILIEWAEESRDQDEDLCGEARVRISITHYYRANIPPKKNNNIYILLLFSTWKLNVLDYQTRFKNLRFKGYDGLKSHTRHRAY